MNWRPEKNDHDSVLIEKNETRFQFFEWIKKSIWKRLTLFNNNKIPEMHVFQLKNRDGWCRLGLPDGGVTVNKKTGGEITYWGITIDQKNRWNINLNCFSKKHWKPYTPFPPNSHRQHHKQLRQRVNIQTISVRQDPLTRSKTIHFLEGKTTIHISSQRWHLLTTTNPETTGMNFQSHWSLYYCITATLPLSLYCAPSTPPLLSSSL